MTSGPAAARRLSELVAAAPGALVLPPRPRAAAVDVPEPLRLDDAMDLGSGRHVAVVSDASSHRWTVPLVVDGDAVRRAVPGDGVAAALVRGRSVAAPFRLEVWERAGLDGERSIGVDQTTESVVVGERAVVKWLLRLPADEGWRPVPPAARRLASLAAGGFSGVPRTWSMLRHGVDLLAVVDEYLPDAEDGWTWAVEDVRALARGELSLDDAVAPAAELGRLTADMHLALAVPGRARATDTDARDWHSDALDDLLAAFPIDEWPGTRVERIEAALRMLDFAAGAVTIDVHGDLHVGQWLRHGAPPRYAVTDFDGNPVVPVWERDRRQPAARDVASMIASLDHVGRIVLRRTDGVDVTAVRGWMRAAEDAFLAAYRSRLAEAGESELLDERLLRPMRLQQECRELIYAERHLPLWRYVPDGALADLLPDEPSED